MERSYSCSHFEATSSAASDINHGNNSVEHQAFIPHAGSSDNLPLTIADSSTQHFPPTKPLRKRRLQRQHSNVHDVDDLDLDLDVDYAADLEEDAEDALVIPRLPKPFAIHSQYHHPHAPLASHRSKANSSAMAIQRHISCSSTNSSIYSSSNVATNQSVCQSPTRRCLRHEESFDSCRTTTEMSSPQAHQRFSNLLLRDSSVQSDSSRYSSVDSLLESRKPDPEAILINLGFGPIGSEDILSRIPKRFLKPSQVRGIDTEAFVKRLQLASSLADSSVMGYRGLTGNPDMPPSSIVAKIMERFEVNQRKKSISSIEHSIR